MAEIKLRVVERRSVKGTPIWYLYTGQKYLGCLFLTDGEQVAALRSLLYHGHGHHSGGPSGEVEFVTGPMFPATTS